MTWCVPPTRTHAARSSQRACKRGKILRATVQRPSAARSECAGAAAWLDRERWPRRHVGGKSCVLARGMAHRLCSRLQRRMTTTVPSASHTDRSGTDHTAARRRPFVDSPRAPAVRHGIDPKQLNRSRRGRRPRPPGRPLGSHCVFAAVICRSSTLTPVAVARGGCWVWD